MKVNISEIKIKKRVRKEIGDLLKLKESMRKSGLINPITINEKKELLAGFRRLQSAISLGWKEIECRVVSAKSKIEKLQIEADENTTRKDFTPREIEQLEERRKYLTAPFFEKIFYWIKMFFRFIREKLFGRSLI